MDEDPTTDEILAAYRSRRQGAASGEALPADPSSPTASTASPQAADREAWATVPDAAPSDAPGAPAVALPAEATEVEGVPAQPVPTGVRPEAASAEAAAASGLVAPRLGTPPQWPAVRPAVQGGGVELSAGSPALNLSSRLMEDRFIARSGNRAGVAIGVAMALVGLTATALDQALRSRGRPLALPLDGIDLTDVGLGLAALGLLIAVPCLFLPRRRTLRVRLAASQQEEWARVKGEAARLRTWSMAGAALALLGLAAAGAAYAFVAPPWGGAVAGGLALLGALGVALLAWAAARRGVVQRLYVQTLVLSRLEQTGLGPAAQADPRIAPVLKSLDRLLGALPESAVRRFLASDEATQYLELIDDLAREPRHGP